MKLSLLIGAVALTLAASESTASASFVSDFTETLKSAGAAIKQLATDARSTKRTWPEAHSSKKRAVVRPFSPHDWQKLIKSFDAWDLHAPCDHEQSSVPVDLFLYYSRTFSKAPFRDTLASAVEALEQRPWRKCFRYFKIIDAKLTEKEDIYDPSQFKTLQTWNQGPNEQFLRLFANLADAGYELFYLNEPDTEPLQSNWLASLDDIIKAQSPFMVIGSTYSGSKWDAFIDELPLAMVNHINGNAVYNVSSTKLRDLVGRMIEEGAGHSSFDLRFAEMLLEEYDAASLAKIGYKNLDEFQNHAASILIKGSLPKSVLFSHGGKQFDAWKASEKLNLLVSHWDNSKRGEETIDTFHTEDHPFSSATVLVYGHEKAAEFNGIHPNVNGAARRYASADYDMCEFDVLGESNWYMLTNSNHRVLDGTIPMKEGKPMLQFSHEPDGTLSAHPMRVVYKTSLAKQYCKETLESGKAPSASEYIAFVKKTSPDAYEWVDIRKYGQYNNFKEIEANASPRRLTLVSRHLESMNHTSCAKLGRKECIANAECDFRWKGKICYVKDCTERQNKKTCIIGNTCAWDKTTKMCSVKTKKPTRAPTSFPTKKPTNSPTLKPTKEPTTGTPTTPGCGVSTNLRDCNKNVNDCFWDSRSKMCVDDVCENRWGSACYKKNYFLKDLGCSLKGKSCVDQTCADVKNRFACALKDVCSWNGRQCEVRTLQPTQAPTENNLDCSAISSSKTCNNQAGCFYRDRKHGCLPDQCSFFGAVRCKRVTSCTWASGTCRAAVCDDFRKNKYACVGEKHGLHCSWTGKTCLPYVR